MENKHPEIRLHDEERKFKMKMSTVNMNIKRCLRRTGKKQKDVALASGFSPAVFSNMDRGERKVYADEVAPIAEALGVPVEDLFMEVSEV